MSTETTEAVDEMAKEAQIRLFELLYIVPNKYTENELPEVTKSVKELIQKQGGKVTNEVNYGKRRFAYPVNHNHYGYYILNNFEMDSAAMKELDKSLRLKDEVLRHLIVIAPPKDAFPKDAGDLRQPEHPIRTEPQREKAVVKPSRKRPSIVDIKATEEEKEKMAKGTAFDLEKELGVTAEEAKKALEKEGIDQAKKEDSVNLDELDSKLDEIMGDLE